MQTKRLFIVATLIFLLGVVWYTGAPSMLSLESVQAHLSEWREAILRSPWQAGFIYFFFYLAFSALSLPGVSVLTLVGGALFPLWQGVILVSLASTWGACLSFLFSRFLLRDWITNRYGRRLAEAQKRFSREGKFYLLTMRLIPAVPYFLINLFMGLTTIPLFTFYWVSQLGMLPGTFIYVNAGRELGNIKDFSGILSPTLWLALCLLAVLPWFVRMALGYRTAK